MEEQKVFYDKFYGGGKAHNFVAGFWLQIRKSLKYANNPVDEIKISKIKEILSQARGKTAIEVGCGTGNTNSIYLATVARDCTFVDLSGVAIEKLSQKLNSAHISCSTLVGDISELDLRKTFDLIYMNGVLHHQTNPKVFLTKLIKNLLNEGGMIVMLEPLNSNPVIRIIRYLGNLFRNNAAWEKPLTLRQINRLAKNFKRNEIYFYEGISVFSWLLSGNLKARVARKLYAFERQLLSKNLLPKCIFLNAVIIFHK